VDRPEFVGLQLSVLVRSDERRSRDVLDFLESLEFRSEMQEEVANLIEACLKAGQVPFEEVIISLSTAPAIARPVEPSGRGENKPSRLARLFGRK
jgi:hypothetical protein